MEAERTEVGRRADAYRVPVSFERRFIAGSGPSRCRVLLVGEAGGADEHLQGRPFVGQAGVVLNTYLAAVGLKRHQLHVDNVYPYWTGPSNPQPTAEQIAEGTPLLESTIRRVQPEIVGCLGAIASRWFLPRVEMKRDHGVCYRVRRGMKTLLVVPCFHPAAGFYDASAAARCQQDLGVLARVIAGEVEPWEEEPLPSVMHAEHPSAHSAYPVPHPENSIDTEGTEKRPLMMSWAGEATACASYWTPGCGAPLIYPGKYIFHYAIHDLPVLRAMGVNTDLLDIDDTMTMAFLLTGGGQDNAGEDAGSPLGLGLKNLAYRDLQVRMQDYKDLVRPYYNKEVEAWVDRLLECELPEKSEPELREGVGKHKGKWVIYTPQPPRARYAAVLKAAHFGGEPEKVWKDLVPAHRKLAEERMGEAFPALSTALLSVPAKKAVRYAGVDAWATKKLEPIYRKRLEAAGLLQVYEIDRRALKFTDDFIRNGMPYDADRVRGMKVELQERLLSIKKKLRKLTGVKGFNPGSRDDVVQYLFRVHGLPAPIMTKGEQESTNEKAVSILRAQVGQGEFKKSEDERAEITGFLDDLLDYREAQKYLGTYIDYIEWETHNLSTARLHATDINTTRVVSGRLAGQLLTFPQRTELGARIRKLFVAPPGKKILSLDYSQIELRGAAELSQDPTMVKAFKENQDLHSLTGTALFKTKDEAVLKKKRPVSKQVNFSVLYGISDKSLWERFALAGIFDYTVRQCQEFIDRWFELYHGIVEYQERLIRESAKTGEVRDWAGRVRYVPNIRMARGRLREKAERDVCNFPVQAGARELVKIAQGDLVDWLRTIRGMVDAILDMHDELLFEVDEDVVEEAAARIRQVMLAEGSKRWSVPIEVGRNWGGSWGEAK